MTSYASEQDFIEDQIRSAKMALSYLRKLVDEAAIDVPPDFLGTDKKVRDALHNSMSDIQRQIKAMRARKKQLNQAGTSQAP